MWEPVLDLPSVQKQNREFLKCIIDKGYLLSLVFPKKIIMKKILAFALLSAFTFSISVQAQTDRPVRKSPLVKITETIKSGATVTIEYSQPSVNGRTIGTDIEPMQKKVWRMGANEATTFEVDKDVTINGQPLPAGKYSVFGISNNEAFTVILNKEWKIWGTQYAQHEDKNVLRFDVKNQKAPAFNEKLSYSINKEGKVSMMWGDMAIEFFVQ
jgi:hypothetical protein